MPLDVDNLKGEFVIDPYRCKERYLAWDRTIDGISPENGRIIVRYLEDMRRGINISPNAAKGKRGYKRLLTQRCRLKRICELLSTHEGIGNIAPAAPPDISVLERAATSLFERMESGEIQKTGGGRFLSVQDLMKSFKAYWHWYMVLMKRERSLSIPDITQFMAVRQTRKPSFVYFGDPGVVDVEDGFRKLFDRANFKYRALMAFLFDSGIRAPTELKNVKRKDVTPIPGTGFFHLNIRDEAAKTFGRRIKLMFCHQVLAAYLEERDLGPEDFVFPICPRVVNQFLKRLGERVLGKPGLTMYDFRHNSVCYFLPRYKNQNALMYRFGWKDPKMIQYYSEFTGMRDTLQEKDFLVGVTTTNLERDLESERRQRQHLADEIGALRAQMDTVNRFLNRLTSDAEVVDVLARKARQLKVRCPSIPVTAARRERARGEGEGRYTA